MSTIVNLVKAPAEVLLKRIPTSILKKIEDVVQKQLGKGAGAWSTDQEAQIISEFVTILGIKNPVAIDAGANLGDWTAKLLECLPDSIIYTFEPSKLAFEKLQSRFSTDHRVSNINLALGKESTSSILYADKSGSGLGSLTKRRVEHFNIEFKHQEKVETKTLDSWLDESQVAVSPNILKMDVEGHEYDLLLGATQSLKNIKIVQFEFGGCNIDTRTFFQDFWYFFKNLNFEIYRLSPSKLILIEKYSECEESFRATNYFAVRSNL